MTPAPKIQIASCIIVTPDTLQKQPNMKLELYH
jgi:hypothetical protein